MTNELVLGGISSKLEKLVPFYSSEFIKSDVNEGSLVPSNDISLLSPLVYCDTGTSWIRVLVIDSFEPNN